MTRIVVIDNDGQFTHLEQRAVRDLGADAQILPNSTPPTDIDADGIILSGGPHTASAERGTRYFSLDIPILGICLGMQDIAVGCGGRVGPGEYGGYADVTVTIDDPSDPLIGSLAPTTQVWASHADEVKEVPDDFTRTAHSDICSIEAISDTNHDYYGVQWHPEVAHTEEGQELLENFIALCRS